MEAGMPDATIEQVTRIHCICDGEQVVCTADEAWAFASGAWQRIDPGAIDLTCATIMEGDFETVFPDVPPLPEGAFRGGRKVS
jgi:hypothetical protein